MLGLLSYIPTFLIIFVLAKRRLNDMDHTGWWSLLIVIPFVNLIFFLWLVFGAGDEGSNSFGPAPCKNSVPVIIGACVMPVFLIGIIAAVAIPAYPSSKRRPSPK
ncbi:MAG: DUF805 domain-containing protein [Pseudomonadota bacterium]